LEFRRVLFRSANVMEITKAASANSDHFAALRQIRSHVHPPLSRRIRVVRSPSIQRSMGRTQASRKTVCGHAYPHQSRPNSEVKKKSENARNSSTSSSRTVSVAV